MAAIINLKHSKRQAFARGVVKGLAGPLMLYSNFTLPPEVQEKPRFEPLPDRKSDSSGDWVRVGDYLRSAAKQKRG